MFNKVVLVGNLTRDIELRYLQTGTAVGKTGIAVTRRYNSSNGEKREETCFIDIDFFGRTAEIANQYLRKGSKILIEGRLKLDQWQAQIPEAQKTITTRLNKKSRVTKARFRKSTSMPINTMTATTRSHFN